MSDGRMLDAEIHRVVFEHEVRDQSPRYSTEDGAAFLVVDRLIELGFGFSLSREPGGWEVEIIVTQALHEQGYRGCYILDNSRQRAICRAALVATGEGR